jgi:hypothetical protein
MPAGYPQRLQHAQGGSNVGPLGDDHDRPLPRPDSEEAVARQAEAMTTTESIRRSTGTAAR